MLRKLSLVAACVASASAFTAPVGLTRASGALAKADAFAAKPALPVVAAVERKNAATSLKMSCTTARTMKTRQQPHRKRCMLLDKIANNKMTVSFSHRRHHKLQQVNLQWKRVWWEEGNAFVRLRISTKAIKTLKTKSVGELAKRVNLDLNKYKCGGAPRPRLKQMVEAHANVLSCTLVRAGSSGNLLPRVSFSGQDAQHAVGRR